METFKIHTEHKGQPKTVEANLKTLNVPFETTGQNPYDPEFVAKIMEIERQTKEGKLKTIKTECS